MSEKNPPKPMMTQCFSGEYTIGKLEKMYVTEKKLDNRNVPLYIPFCMAFTESI